jgi:hypothetical protein
MDNVSLFRIRVFWRVTCLFLNRYGDGKLCNSAIDKFELKDNTDIYTHFLKH